MRFDGFLAQSYTLQLKPGALSIDPLFGIVMYMLCTMSELVAQTSG